MAFGLIYTDDIMLGVSNDAESYAHGSYTKIDEDLTVFRPMGKLEEFKLRNFSKQSLDYLKKNLPEKEVGFTWNEIFDEYHDKSVDKLKET